IAECKDTEQDAYYAAQDQNPPLVCQSSQHRVPPLPEFRSTTPPTRCFPSVSVLTTYQSPDIAADYAIARCWSSPSGPGASWRNGWLCVCIRYGGDTLPFDQP